MRKYIKIILATLCIIILTGCGNTLPVTTSNDVIKAVSEKKYEYQYYKDYENDKFDITEALTTRINDNTILEFYVFSANEEAASFYNSITENVKNTYSAKPTIDKSKKDRSFFILSEKDEYFRISMINNTILYGYSNTNNQKPIDEIFTTLSY